jgi:hypothetical protein
MLQVRDLTVAESYRRLQSQRNGRKTVESSDVIGRRRAGSYASVAEGPTCATTAIPSRRHTAVPWQFGQAGAARWRQERRRPEMPILRTTATRRAVDTCPAFGKQCRACGNLNHFESVCKSSRRKQACAVDIDDEALTTRRR